MLRNAISMVLILAAPYVASAQDSKENYDESEVLFARHVQTLLVEKCVACHGSDPEDINGGLDLRALSTTLKGGDTEEPAVVVGEPEASPLYLAATRNSDWSDMPPKEAEALSEQELKWLSDWIAAGAKWPNDKRIADISAKYADAWSVEDGITVATSGGLADSWTNRRYRPEGLWAYQPLDKIELDEDESSLHAVDALLSRRRPEKLSVAPEAERFELIRRATYDLTGLPPTPEEVDNFVTDTRPTQEAFAELVDRLLASPHYGERMAQHWLDVVRYADSSGFANDYQRGNAWRYRDYVIRAFNNDKPFDQFVVEQIAGDELAAEETENGVPNPELIVATGFLRMGPWELTGMEVAKIARQRFLDDVTNSVGETFLGHSLQCARCHDHKFDPVPTQDYYGIQAVFATTQLADRKTAFTKQENRSGFEEKAYLLQRKADYQEQLKRLDKVLLENAQQWYAERGLSPEQWNASVEKLRNKKVSQVFNAVRGEMGKLGLKQSEYPPKNYGFTPEQFGLERVARKGLQRLAWELERYQPVALAVYNGRTPQVNSVTSPKRVPSDRLQKGELENTCILTGGDPFSPSTPVDPTVLSVLNNQLHADIPTSIEGRRLEFARWVANPENPLTPRVIVNRVWQWHFGNAIAGNPNNFGSTGKPPTHPELLDWLAAELIEDNWSIKSLHRKIMLSEAYRQSTFHPEPELLRELDPLGETYSVFQRRRLSAEELRDAMLAASGELNREMGGIPCRPEINAEVAMQPRQVMGTFAAAWEPNPLPEDRHRRSIYALKLRGLVNPLFEVFNAPGPDFSCERRESSTVTPQVFALYNGSNTYARALSLAIDCLASSSSDEEALEACFLRLLSRAPTADELEACLDHWQAVEPKLPPIDVSAKRPNHVVREAVEENTGERFSFRENLYSSRDFVADHKPTDVTPHSRGLADVCHALINSNEFVYID